MTPNQLSIIDALDVRSEINPGREAVRRIGFLADYLIESGATGYVLGISGGVDSTVAGRLAQLACAMIGKTFTAMRLPYGKQADEADAQDALAFIGPESLVTVDIKPGTDALAGMISPKVEDDAAYDFMKGNIKARQRMVAQYAVAGAKGALVIGTDHAAEAVMGFFTKHGDGACDITPLAGLTKGQVREIAEFLGAPAHIISKAPTADLEDNRPGLPDEVAYGVTYEQIDAYLRGADCGSGTKSIIETAYAKTAHKRALPITPEGF